MKDQEKEKEAPRRYAFNHDAGDNIAVKKIKKSF